MPGGHVCRTRRCNRLSANEAHGLRSHRLWLNTQDELSIAFEELDRGTFIKDK